MLPDKVVQPTACYFCNITSLLGRQSRTKTGAQIVAELDGLYRIGWRGLVFFVDDNLIGNKQNLGRDLLDNVKSIQRAGMQVQAGFIVGFDSDLPPIFQRQVEFIQQSGIVTAMVGLLQAIPDTRLYKRLQQEGRILRNPTGDNVDGTTNFIPRMNLDALNEGYKSILRRIYAPRPYYQRIRTFLREYHPPHIRTSFSWNNLKTLMYSNVRLGIVGHERFQYWGLLVWTLCRRPALLQTAITLAIYGHHFRKVCTAIGV